MQEALEQANKTRKKKLEKLRCEESKKKRIKWKNARDLEQEERKRWAKQQEIKHDYGEEDDLEVDDDSTNVKDLLDSSSVSRPDKTIIIASKKRCKCGSPTHLRTSHRQCPMNKGKIIRHDNGEEEDKDDLEVDNDSTDVRDLFGSSSVSGLEKTLLLAKAMQVWLYYSFPD